MNIGASSGNSYVSSPSSNKGMSGLISGLDTNGMVDALLANAQAKIDKQNALKQQTLWKQEIYRSLITKITSFQSKYFSSSSSTNLLGQNFYNLMTAATNSSRLTATATSSAAVGTTRVRVDKLASNSKMTSGTSVSGSLDGTVSETQLNNYVSANKDADRKVVFQVGQKEVTVDLKDVFVDAAGGFTDPAGRQQAIAQKINDAFTDAGVTGVSANITNGSLTVTADDGKQGISISGKSSELGLKALGLKSGAAGAADGDKAVLSGNINTKNEFSLDISLDDNKKTINLDLESMVDANGKIDLSKVNAELTNKINKAHGVGQITANIDTNTGKIVIDAVGDGRKVLVGGSATALEAFGYKNGQSNRIGMGGSIFQQAFNTELQGSNFKFNINGVDFEFDENASMSEVMSKINGSDAGVRVVYKSLEDKFVMEATNSGSGFDISMSQTEGNLLNAMFGDSYQVGGNTVTLASGNSITSKVLTKSTIASSGPTIDNSTNKIEEGVFKFSVRGKSYEYTIPKRDDANGGAYSLDEVITELNNKLKSDFDGDITIDANGNVKNNAGAEIKIENNAMSTALGLGGKTSIIDDSATLDELGLSASFVNDIGNGITGSSSIKDLNGLSVNGVTFSYSDGKLTATAAAAFNGSFGTADDMNKLFGTDTLSLNNVRTDAAYQASYSSGENAKLNIDGVDTERSSNTFTINGINFQLKSETPTGEFEEITVSRGTDQIVEGIKSFINDYNTLIGELNDLIREDPAYKKYPPLTDAQKKEMSEKEIDLWQIEAKKGLLRNDTAIAGFLNTMRTAMYEKPMGSLLAIYDIGIETSSDWKDQGKLVLSTDGEAKLRKLIDSNPEDVMRLFTDEKDGLASKLNNIIKSAANTSSASPGSLVQIAGMKNKASDTNNDLHFRLKAIDEKIANLKRSYQMDKDRYWKQFNAMEVLMSNMNSQSQWLSSQYGLM